MSVHLCPATGSGQVLGHGPHPALDRAPPVRPVRQRFQPGFLRNVLGIVLVQDQTPREHLYPGVDGQQIGEQDFRFLHGFDSAGFARLCAARFSALCPQPTAVSCQRSAQTAFPATL